MILVVTVLIGDSLRKLLRQGNHNYSNHKFTRADQGYDLNSKRQEVTDYIQRIMERFVDSLLPASLWDSIFIIVCSMLAVITNKFPQWLSFWNYSFATIFLAISSALVIRVCVVISAIVYYRAVITSVELDDTSV